MGYYFKHLIFYSFFLLIKLNFYFDFGTRIVVGKFSADRFLRIEVLWLSYIATVKMKLCGELIVQAPL